MHNAHASLPDAWALPDAHTSLGKQPKDVRAADVKEPAARKKTQGRPRGPKGWPDDILYLVSNDMSLSSLSAHDKRMVRPGASSRIPGIEIRKITDPAHPAYGQNGLYATRDFGVGEVLGEYTGFVMPGHMGGEYTTRLWDTDAEPGNPHPACNASKGGNEFRFINDFRCVPGDKGSNVRFSACHIQGARSALIVAIKDVAEGEEFLLDYGEQYWSAETLALFQTWKPSDTPAVEE
eukprot:CAMPEP_0180301196 /NCGR_PEP_ID=MMETSP0988-20121125/23319_1 /TAXON_ID=697907 /ORGANISM="non described non described, Strain CCMP2293" /LENGTH=235 /DNA_ID=CAMNT_0022281657 /DNA_START=16 /DNA_END=723 /DNA_ORIENTATION=-